MADHIHLSIEDDGTAVIRFDQQKSQVNLFDRSTLAELESQLEEARSSHASSLLILSDKKDSFIAGADIKLLADAQPDQIDELIHHGQKVFTLLASMPFPTVAAIHGACVGGGYELALACDWRIASDHRSTKIGLPEIRLGILPAWGGTTRLPRLIGLPKALSVILAGKTMAAKAALHKGMVDAVVPRELLLEHARTFLTKGKRRPKSHYLLHNRLSTKLIHKWSAHTVTKQTRGLYPAPLMALDVACKGVHSTPEESFKREREAILELAPKQETSNLIRLFFETNKARKLSIPNTSAKSITHPAVIGAGVMGAGIAYWLSQRGFPVLLQDINHDALATGLQRIDKLYAKAVDNRVLTPTEAARGRDRIHTAVGDVPLDRYDLVIEASIENLEIKQELFTNLAKRCTPGCILATNTSALPLHKIAEHINRPGRFVGLHFFNPVHRMPLVEVINASKTSKQTLATAIGFVHQLGKMPVIVEDSPGFLVNRILVPYLIEAANLFADGVDPKAIDEAMLDFGMPMGPLRLLDEVGLDVAHQVAQTLANAYPERITVPAILSTMLDRGMKGKKSGKGFYLHRQAKTKPNPRALLIRRPPKQAPPDLATHLATLMSDEAARCLDEGIASDANTIDFAMVMATGYPPRHGGPLQYTKQAPSTSKETPNDNPPAPTATTP